MMEPQDFGELYESLWEQILSGDSEGSRSMIKALQALVMSDQETNQLGAREVLQKLSAQMHEMVKTQQLEPLQCMERHEYEELLMLIDNWA
ncbi:hypothetical protein [Ammoniphilus sp. CFH 90114]|uniref:hypothetical protein n=1 Tax=Ammoniphilus sp. CFH 90114 TaxID=2493665 RepID=UPI00100F1E13|nr:hypothetical protein [Ammoniphilus sp. CFH 90114]RXT08058.1 hypothetical protein EIZ39_11650 [Ammoniphilus sp. CFH 90114]